MASNPPQEQETPYMNQGNVELRATEINGNVVSSWIRLGPDGKPYAVDIQGCFRVEEFAKIAAKVAALHVAERR